MAQDQDAYIREGVERAVVLMEQAMSELDRIGATYPATTSLALAINATRASFEAVTPPDPRSSGWPARRPRGGEDRLAPAPAGRVRRRPLARTCRSRHRASALRQGRHRPAYAIASASWNLIELQPALRSAMLNVSAPVFNAQGEVHMALAMNGFAQIGVSALLGHAERPLRIAPPLTKRGKGKLLNES